MGGAEGFLVGAAMVSWYGAVEPSKVGVDNTAAQRPDFIYAGAFATYFAVLLAAKMVCSRDQQRKNLPQKTAIINRLGIAYNGNRVYLSVQPLRF